jgi:hypothetical protein
MQPHETAEAAEPAASTGWVEAALVIFFIVFVLIVLGLVFSRSSRWRKAAQIPLEDDRVVTPRYQDRETEAPGPPESPGAES